MGELMTSQIQGVVDSIFADYTHEGNREVDKLDIFNKPSKKTVVSIVDKLLRIIFPGYVKDKTYRFYDIGNNLTVVIEDVAYNLTKQIAIALRYKGMTQNVEIDHVEDRAEQATLTLLKTIPKIREYIETDIDAIFEGDPAAESKAEVIFSYPGLFAISIHRIAHILYKMQIPIIPRVMAEYAHSKTGIEINPGAEIGKYFFIDQGTGIVVGETTIIGEHVKLYQGVTLGALSLKDGRKLQHKKRHPTIEDNVTIYSGASIMGGDTVIGKGSVIGGNVFITKSVAPGTKVSVKNQELRFDADKKAVEPVADENDETWFYII